jgi:hypothetical protein
MCVSGLTSDVPPYKGFKEDFDCQFMWFAYFSRSDLQFNLGRTWGQIPIKVRLEVGPWSDLGSTLVRPPQGWPFLQFVWSCLCSKLCWPRSKPPQFCVLRTIPFRELRIASKQHLFSNITLTWHYNAVQEVLDYFLFFIFFELMQHPITPFKQRTKLNLSHVKTSLHGFSRCAEFPTYHRFANITFF